MKFEPSITPQIVDEPMIPSNRKRSKAFDFALKCFGGAVATATVFVILFGWGFGFLDFFVVSKYDHALKTGNGKSAVFWIKRSFGLRYYVIGPDEEFHYAECLEMNGEYENALLEYDRITRYGYCTNSVKLAVPRLFYKMDRKTEAFELYYKVIPTLQYGGRVTLEYDLTGYNRFSQDTSPVLAHLTPFHTKEEFYEFMNSELRKRHHNPPPYPYY